MSMIPMHLSKAVVTYASVDVEKSQLAAIHSEMAMFKSIGNCGKRDGGLWVVMAIVVDAERALSAARGMHESAIAIEWQVYWRCFLRSEEQTVEYRAVSSDWYREYIGGFAAYSLYSLTDIYWVTDLKRASWHFDISPVVHQNQQ